MDTDCILNNDHHRIHADIETNAFSFRIRYGALQFEEMEQCTEVSVFALKRMARIFRIFWNGADGIFVNGFILHVIYS